MTTFPLAVGKYAVATNDNGDVMVIWQAGGAAASPFYAARYTIGGGWESPTTLDNHMVLGRPTITMDANGDAVVVYSPVTPVNNIEVSGIAATTYQAGIGWSTPESLETYLAGSPINLNLQSDAQGRAIAIWETPGTAQLPVHLLQVARYDSVNGWMLPAPTWGGLGHVSFPMLSVGSSGKAAAVWTELGHPMVGRWIGF
jgi:hypothetical protein